MPAELQRIRLARTYLAHTSGNRNCLKQKPAQFWPESPDLTKLSIKTDDDFNEALSGKSPAQPFQDLRRRHLFKRRAVPHIQNHFHRHAVRRRQRDEYGPNWLFRCAAAWTSNARHRSEEHT